MIKVSVIMPVYNAAKYIQVAMDSLLIQTLHDIEIICVDDGSTDESRRILEEYAALDQRVRVLSQINCYAGAARNLGMTVASGRYLSFLDADDYFKPKMLEKAYLCAEQYSADIVVYGGEYFEDTPQKAYRNSALLKEELLPEDKDVIEKGEIDYLFHFTTSCPWNKLYRRTFITKHSLSFQNCKRVNDAYFVEVAFALAERIGLVREELVSYRTGNSGSLQGTNAESPLQFIEVIRDIKNKLIELGVLENNIRSFRNYCLTNCIYNLESIKDGKAFERLYYVLKEKVLTEFDLAGNSEEEYYNKYAYQSYQYILTHSAVEYWQKKYMGTAQTACRKEYLFPFEAVNRDSAIILYAAGNVGTTYFRQIRKSGYCHILAWVDKKVRAYESVTVSYPEDVDMKLGDYIIIAVESAEAATAIRRDLIDKFNVDQDKIIWKEPVIGE